MPIKCYYVTCRACHTGIDRLHACNSVIAGETVYAAGREGVLHALAPENGSNRWTYDIGASVSAAPMIVDGVVFVADEESVVHI